MNAKASETKLVNTATPGCSVSASGAPIIYLVLPDNHPMLSGSPVHKSVPIDVPGGIWPETERRKLVNDAVYYFQCDFIRVSAMMALYFCSEMHLMLFDKNEKDRYAKHDRSWYTRTATEHSPLPLPLFVLCSADQVPSSKMFGGKRMAINPRLTFQDSTWINYLLVRKVKPFFGKDDDVRLTTLEELLKKEIKELCIPSVLHDMLHAVGNPRFKAYVGAMFNGAVGYAFFWCPFISIVVTFFHPSLRSNKKFWKKAISYEVQFLVQYLSIMYALWGFYTVMISYSTSSWQQFLFLPFAAAVLWQVFLSGCDKIYDFYEYKMSEMKPDGTAILVDQHGRIQSENYRDLKDKSDGSWLNQSRSQDQCTTHEFGAKWLLSYIPAVIRRICFDPCFRCCGKHRKCPTSHVNLLQPGVVSPCHVPAMSVNVTPANDTTTANTQPVVVRDSSHASSQQMCVSPPRLLLAHTAILMPPEIDQRIITPGVIDNNPSITS